MEAALEPEVLAAGGDRVDAGALGDDADRAAHPVGVAQHVVPGDGGRTGVGAGQGGEDLDGGGLAGAVGAEEPEDRACLDVERQPVERLDVPRVGFHQSAGLVAVMFTDMVGYTALIQADERLGLDKRDRYMSALESHHDAFGGTIVQRLGDGSMSMFPSSLAAVLAAVEIQRELAAQDVPVRIGVHVGEVIVEPERLTGDAVNIAARIESFAVPGGVMLSDSAYDQIKNRSDVGVVRLGRFRLKNVGRPFELYAVSADGVVVPDPEALEGKGERFASLPSNLPEPTAPLVGRAADLASLVELAREHRVVTITGPGGVGKTRIVVELGRLLAPEFLDGVAFVALADVTEPADFLPALADALDVKEAEGRTLGEGVAALIGDKKALLLLDNLEQVVAAAPDVAGLIERCPELRIVTTSRTPLRIAAEREYPLAPLELPHRRIRTRPSRSARIRRSRCSSSARGRPEARSS